MKLGDMSTFQNVNAYSFYQHQGQYAAFNCCNRVTIMSKCHRKRIEICIGVCKGTLPGIFYDLLTVSFVSAMIDKCLTFIHILINLSSINPLSFTFGVPNILESYLK